MTAYSTEAMKAAFWKLTAEKEALNVKLAPFREKRDALRDLLRGPVAKYREAKQAVVDVERPKMSELDTEMAVLARALGNKVGPRPE